MISQFFFLYSLHDEKAISKLRQASVLLSSSVLTAVIYQVKHRLKAPTLIRKFDISLWFPCGAYGLAYGHVITKISRIRHLHISHKAPFLPPPLPPAPPPKFWITFVFHSPGYYNRPKRNWKQCLCKIWAGWRGGGGQIRCIMGDVQAANGQITKFS